MSHTLMTMLSAAWLVLTIALVVFLIRLIRHRTSRKTVLHVLLAQVLCFFLAAGLSGNATEAQSTADSSASPSASASSSSTALVASTAASTPTPSAPVQPSAGFSAVFIDVGQGDATLLVCDGHAMLIDGGTADQSQKIYAILQERSITHLDYIVCSHPHEDHAGGLSGALAYATCDQALAPVESSDNSAFTAFTETLSRNGIPLHVPAVGDQFQLGTAVMTVLGPTDIEPAMDVNDMSLVLRIDYGDTSFLFTGDAEQEEQQLLMWNEYDQLHATVLKAAHHGAANGASYAWIKAVQPDVTIISCGAGNDYGHPHEATLNLLKEYGSSLYRTDLQGDITVTSDGKQVSVSPAVNPEADVWQPGTAAIEKSIPSSIETAATATAAATAAAAAADTEQQTYVVNTNTRKFHRPNCSAVKKMKAKNRWDYTGTRQSLIDQGYEPCQICKP